MCSVGTYIVLRYYQSCLIRVYDLWESVAEVLGRVWFLLVYVVLYCIVLHHNLKKISTRVGILHTEGISWVTRRERLRVMELV